MKPFPKRLAELQVAFMLLTRLPAGRIQGPAPSLSQAIWAYPFVGLVIGIILYLVNLGGNAVGLPSIVSAWVTLSILALITGGLHFDGLADFADGIGGGQDKERSLEIMRDSRIGSYGVLALIAATGLWTTSVASILDGPSLVTWIILPVASRLIMAYAAIKMPAARTDGLGNMASGSGLSQLVPGVGLVFALACFAPLPSLIAILSMTLVFGIVATLAIRKIGGQTGDVLGAIQLSCETFGWVAVCALAAS